MQIFNRGDRVRYACANRAEAPYDPLDGLVGTVTHFDGDENGDYNNAGAGNAEVWVEFDTRPGCWVLVDDITRI